MNVMSADPFTKDHTSSRRSLAVAMAMLLFCHPATAAQKAAPKIDFHRDIHPILSDHCYACHGPDEKKRKAGLRLDQKEDAFKILKSGDRAIVPGDLRRARCAPVDTHDPDEVMPPPKGRQAAPGRADRTADSLGQGGGGVEEPWSFIAPERPALPRSTRKWPERDRLFHSGAPRERGPLNPRPTRTNRR